MGIPAAEEGAVRLFGDLADWLQTTGRPLVPRGSEVELVTAFSRPNRSPSPSSGLSRRCRSDRPSTVFELLAGAGRLGERSARRVPPGVDRLAARRGLAKLELSLAAEHQREQLSPTRSTFRSLPLTPFLEPTTPTRERILGAITRLAQGAELVGDVRRLSGSGEYRLASVTGACALNATIASA